MYKGYLLHALALGSGPYTRHGQTHGDGRALALVEQLRLQEDLCRYFHNKDVKNE